MAYNSFEVILFDLGGVLMELELYPRMSQWLKQSLTEEEFGRRWLLSPAVRAFESGSMNAAEFSEALVAELELTIAPERFLAEFSGFIKGFYPGAVQLVKRLQTTYRVGCFSNTNVIHWERFVGEAGIDKLFDPALLSFELGLLKPDPEAFAAIVERLGCQPRQILYFDDNPLNVAAGEQAGLYTLRTVGIEEVQAHLVRLGLLSELEIAAIAEAG